METKLNLDEATLEMLQSLIQVNTDSHDGFVEAADNTDDMSVSAIFTELAAQRKQQAEELAKLVAANHRRPEQAGSAAAAMHRTWMDLRSTFGGGVHAMLSEAERGEDHIKGRYESALKTSAGGAVTDVLNRQYAAVKAAHDRVRDLRDAYGKK